MREENNDPGKKTDFYMVEAKQTELVSRKIISEADLGALAFMGCQVNPHNGYWMTNQSIYAKTTGISTNKAHHRFNKLIAARLIRFFYLHRGRHSIGLLFVMGRSLAKKQIVNDEFVSKIAKMMGAFQELESPAKNKKEEEIPNTATTEKSETPIITLDANNDKTFTDTKTDTKKDKRQISKETYAGLRAAKGDKEAREYVLEKGYRLPEGEEQCHA